MQATAEVRGLFGRRNSKTEQMEAAKDCLTLLDAEEGRTYIVREIRTDDEEMNAFLFRLGCYSGEPITVISRKRKSCTVAIKNSRYTLDRNLCEAVIL